MTTEDWAKELEQDMYEEARRDFEEECQLRRDIDHAYETLGIYEISQEIEDLIKNMSAYEHIVSLKDVLIKLEEI